MQRAGQAAACPQGAAWRLCFDACCWIIAQQHLRHLLCPHAVGSIGELCPVAAASSCVAAKADHYLRGEIPRIIEFANSIARESDNLDDTVVRNCVNLLGDVCTVIPNVGGAFNNSSKEWEQLMVYCQDSGHLLGDTEWAINAVRGALN